MSLCPAAASMALQAAQLYLKDSSACLPTSQNPLTGVEPVKGKTTRLPNPPTQAPAGCCGVCHFLSIFQPP